MLPTTVIHQHTMMHQTALHFAVKHDAATAATLVELLLQRGAYVWKKQLDGFYVSVFTDRSMERKQKKLCPHQRQRTQRKDCGGAAFCEHQRVRSRCKDCGGSAICEHQRQRSQCKDCMSQLEAS